MAETTTIELKIETYKRLNGRKGPGESFDDVVRRILEGDQEGERVQEAAEGRADGGIPLTCGKCDHSWSYGGKSSTYATCPDCKSNVKIEG